MKLNPMHFAACLLLAMLTMPQIVQLAAADEAVPGAPMAEADDAGFEKLPNGDVRLGKITLHRETREISFPATIIMTAGELEVLIATPVGRLHESLLRSEASPLQLQTMLYLLKYENGPRLPDKDGRRGNLLDIFIEWVDAEGQPQREPVEHWVTDTRTEQTMERTGWVFVGSGISDGEFIAETTGNLVLLFSIGDTILNNTDPDARDDTLYVVNENKQDPGKNAEVRVILVRRPPEEEADATDGVSPEN